MNIEPVGMTRTVKAAHRPQRPAPLVVAITLACASGLVVAFVSTLATSAAAATAPVGLGGATPYSVVAGSTVTNTGPSVLGGSLGLSPGSSVTGFPSGLVGGDTHVADATASRLQSDIVNSWTVAAGRAPDASVAGDLVGQTFTPGVYKSTSSLHLSGAVTLDAKGNPASVFIFQVASTLITSTSSKVVLINGAQACNLYWQVGSSATLGVTSVFKGTIIALTSITADTGANLEGRALAHNGAVTLDSNVITTPGCDLTPSGSSSRATTTPSGGTSGKTTSGGGTGTTPGGGTTGATTQPGGTQITATPASRTTPATSTPARTGTPPRSSRTTPQTPLSTPKVPAITGVNLFAIGLVASVLLLLGMTALVSSRRTGHRKPKRQ